MGPICRKRKAPLTGLFLSVLCSHVADAIAAPDEIDAEAADEIRSEAETADCLSGIRCSAAGFEELPGSGTAAAVANHTNFHGR